MGVVHSAVRPPRLFIASPQIVVDRINGRHSNQGGYHSISAEEFTMGALMLSRSAVRVLLAGALLAGLPAALVAKDEPAKAAAKEAGARPAVQPNAPEEPKDMVRLFKADSLEGWDGDPRLWRVENGVVIGQTTPEKQTKGNTFLVWKGGEVADFELRFSFRIKGGNSGCQYRSTLMPVTDPNAENKWRVKGYQAEVANQAGKVGFIYHEGGPGKARGYESKGNYLNEVGDKVTVDKTGRSQITGALGDKAAIAAAYKPGDWNDYIIIAKGNHIRQYINGVQTADLTDDDEKNRMMKGILALQIHAGPPMMVEFKDVRLKQ
jgi:hypothetical protein